MEKITPRSKRIGLLCLFAVIVATVTACNGVPVKTEQPVSLPTVTVPYVAPIGDAALEYTADATLYLPSHDGTRLISTVQPVVFSAARLNAESIVRALLLYPGDSMASALGGSVKLSLYGANPVETSGDVATVNLAASALQLDRKTLYLCGQALTNTLTELNGIRYVNILVMDKQIGLDLASTLPMGALTRSYGGSLGAAYEQALSQRAQTDANLAEQRLSATVALYYPLASQNGVISEARHIAFASQSPEDMATRILTELSEGAVTVQGSPALPLLSGLLVEPPSIDEPVGGGGKIVTLRFDAALYDVLAAAGVPRASCFASLCYTLSTFLPNVTGVVMYIGDELVEHVMLGATEGILFENGVQQRSQYAPYLMDECTLYFADAQNERLLAVKRPIPFYLRANPRALLLELFQGPSAADRPLHGQAVLPVGELTDADVLGLSLSDRTLVVNLSNRFMQAADGLSEKQDRLLAYSIVNTLLCGDHADRLCFFTAGAMPNGLSGEIEWAGLFYRNIGLSGT